MTIVIGGNNISSVYVDGDQGTPGKAGTDGKTPYLHTAYSWSADGMDRFTTVYPRENLVDRTKTVLGYVNADAGSITSPSAVLKELATEYLPVDSGQTIYIQQRVTVEIPGGDAYGWWGIGFYDENKTFISRPFGISKTVQDGTEVYFESKLTAPDNARFMRVSWRNYNGSKIKVEVGEEPTAYTTAPSENMSNAYPKFIGTYTDYIAEDSKDPAKYEWIPISHPNEKNVMAIYVGSKPVQKVYKGSQLIWSTKFKVGAIIGQAISTANSTAGYTIDISKAGWTSGNYDDYGRVIYTFPNFQINKLPNGIKLRFWHAEYSVSSKTTSISASNIAKGVDIIVNDDRTNVKTRVQMNGKNLEIITFNTALKLYEITAY